MAETPAKRCLGAALMAILAAAKVSGQIITNSWVSDVSDASWTDAANWAMPLVPNGTDHVAYLTNNISADRAINLAGDIRLGRLLLGDGFGTSAFILQSGTLTFQTSGGDALLASAKGANSISSAVALSNSLVARLASGFTLAGPVSGGGGLTLIGGDNPSMTGSNTYTGATVIDGGSWFTRSAGFFLSGTGSLRVQGGATFRNGDDQTAQNGGMTDRINPNARLTLGGTASSGGTFTMGLAANGTTYSQSFATLEVAEGRSTINAATPVAGSTVNLRFGGYERSRGGVVNFSDTSPAFHPQFAATPTGDAVVGGILVGALLNGTGLVAAVAGDIASPTYTTQNDPSLWGAPGNQGNIRYNSPSPTNSPTAGGTINSLTMLSPARKVVIASGSTLVLDSGMLVIGTGIATNGLQSADATARLTSGNGRDLIVVCYTNSGLAAVISDNGSTSIGVTKAGAGTLTFGYSTADPANTYSGPTTVTEGWLQSRKMLAVPGDLILAGGSYDAQVSGSMSAAGNLIVNDGTFSLGSRTQQVASLSGPGGIVNVTDPSGSGRLIVDSVTNTSFGGVLIGKGTLEKRGPGLLDLAGDVFITNVIVTGGTLRFNRTLSNVGEPVEVYGAGAVGGTGTINRATMIGPGGRLAPGNSAGVLSVAELTLQNGAVYDWELDSGASDSVAVAGNLSLTDGATFTVNLHHLGGPPPTADQQFNLITWSGTDPSGSWTFDLHYFDGLADGNGAAPNLVIDYDDNRIYLIGIIPEPDTAALVIGSLCLLAVIGRITAGRKPNNPLIRQ